MQGYLVLGFDFGFRLHKLTFFTEDRERSVLLQRKVYPYMK